MLLREKMEKISFSNTESAIISYIQQHPQQLKTATIKELANKTFSAPSTFIRIAHKMGFTGWNEFKDALCKENDYFETHFKDIDANQPFKGNDTIMSITSKIAQLEQEAIIDTASLITHDDLQHALNYIRKAETIHVFAVSNNIYLANQFAHQMSRIQRDVRIHSLQSELMFNAVLTKPNSCAIILSYSGETDILKNCIKALKANQIPIISLTSLGDNSISKNSDVNLRICTREKLYTKIGNFTVNTSIHYVLDVLYACIFAEHFDQNLDLKIQASSQIESGHYSSIEILKEEDHQFKYE